MTDFPPVHVLDEHTDVRSMSRGTVVNWPEPEDSWTDAERVMWRRHFEGKYAVLFAMRSPSVEVPITGFHILDHLPTRVEAHAIGFGLSVTMS